jgi:opacity protein-like surface antigen
MQLKEYKTGKLYLELPLLMGGRAASSVSGVVSSSTQAGIYFTPGLRFNLTLHPRTSFYAMGGAGVAAFDEEQHVVGKGVVTSSNGWESSFAVAFGGGLDFRLTRLISLRGEVRDFVSKKGIGLTDGRNHVVFGFGMGFHW